ncbi:cation diffusion facilitator family transporter [Roseimicrobium sp. ORNL1]|uniref:cation diffusion facilitator family transporter n=1 Tax=Roseimicrobium sp. ORNL1 TaxID=2711231 RepID=UPI0013E1BD90|nr:cation diffusion facilitator family transporter [Roseimicrobium sp. ORNL1]QIF03970.1 cation transporter [Roseimicrobium sp. ORNL1]
MSSASSPVPLTHYAWLSIAAAVVTFTLKMTAWWFTGSVGLLSDGLESLVNFAAAVIALVALKVAAIPADDDHAYGHTKVEYFSSGMEGGLIVLAAVGIAWTAISRLVHPEPLEAIGLGLWLSTSASLINLAVAQVLYRVGKKEHSVTLQASGDHLMTDVWTSAAVIVAVGLVAFTGWQMLDPIIGLFLAGHIVFVGVRLVRQSLLGLMDTGLDAEDMAVVNEVLDHHRENGVQFHALRTRQAGAWRFMSVHVLVPGDWTVARGHELSEEIENELRERLPRLTALTHLEPVEDPVSYEDVPEKREKPREAV